MALSRRKARALQISERAQAFIDEETPSAWNRWRRYSNLFGDHVEARIDLTRSNLSRKDLRSFVLTNVDFTSANLTEANLQGCDCTSCNFHQANLIGTNMRGSGLRGANLSRAYLRGAILDEADLRAADLRRASLTGTSLMDADLRGVDLTSTRGLAQEQLEEARGDAKTALPSHLQRPEHWTRYSAARKPADIDGAVPEILPATVEAMIQSDRLILAADSGDALFTNSFDEREIRQNILDDISNIIPRLSNVRELHRACDKYIESLSRDNIDIIIVGMRGEYVAEQLKTLAQEPEDSGYLLPDVIGALNGVLLQHHLYVNQSHKWRSFLEEASKSRFSSSDIEASQTDANGLSTVLRAGRAACDPEVPEALDKAATEVIEHAGRPRLAIFNLYASVNNILRGLASWAVREFKRGSKKSWDSFRDELSTRVGQAGATLVVASATWFSATLLAERWPEYFGWFKFFVNLLG